MGNFVHITVDYVRVSYIVAVHTVPYKIRHCMYTVSTEVKLYTVPYFSLV